MPQAGGALGCGGKNRGEDLRQAHQGRWKILHKRNAMRELLSCAFAQLRPDQADVRLQ